MPRLTKPHCFLVYALAPEHLTPTEANATFNDFIADKRLPLVLFHDHFIGQLGGVAIFYAESAQQSEALLNFRTLEGWQVTIHPLVYSDSPAGFDSQIAFTLRNYRNVNWKQLRHQQHPDNTGREAEAGQKDSAET